MARNRYPEETVNRILDVSMKLFMEKGYDHTTLQDIIDNLGGLTKGAIYHHFKSKEDILFAVAERIYAGHDELMAGIRDDPTLTGLEKLQKMFSMSLQSPKQAEMFSVAPSFLNNPQLLAIQMKSTVQEGAPLFVQKVVEQGIADGTIQTDYPKELTEVMLILANFWVNPMMFPGTKEDLARKLEFFNYLFGKLGLNLLDDNECKTLEALRVLSEHRPQDEAES